MKGENYISIMTASRGYFVPFTQDKELLLAEIDQLHNKLDFTQSLRRQGCVTMTDAQAEEIEVFASVPGNRAFDVAMAEAEACGIGAGTFNTLVGGTPGAGVGGAPIDATQQVLANYVRTWLPSTWRDKEAASGACWTSCGRTSALSDRLRRRNPWCCSPEASCTAPFAMTWSAW